MKPKKHFGQHFLTSQAAVFFMVQAGKVDENDTVLEIGPGKGVLTQKLLETGASVVAIEKDKEMLPILSETFAKEMKEENLVLLSGDFLDMDEKTLNYLGDYKVVANIPYYINGQIIEKLLTTKNQPKSITVLVQKEVAERIIAKDGKESILSVSVKVYGEPSIKRTVKAGSFFPKPKVDSAILHIENISKINFEKNNISEKIFFEVVHAAFGQKRKTISNCLKKYKNSKEVFEKLGLTGKERAEDLEIENLIKIASLLDPEN